ncbi:hypothetical protein BS78_10G268600 [Paspalum vaginatum]|nr:hypothetical protein BS78_10G268600 [Paspalum vaginatum]
MDAIFGGGVAIEAEEDPVAVERKPKIEPTNKGKRKRVPDDEVALMSGLTEAIKGFSAAVGDAILGLYQAVMACPGFSREALMEALGHLTEKKAIGLMFVEMTSEDRDLWLRTYLAKSYYM